MVESAFAGVAHTVYSLVVGPAHSIIGENNYVRGLKLSGCRRHYEDSTF